MVVWQGGKICERYQETQMPKTINHHIHIVQHINTLHHQLDWEVNWPKQCFSHIIHRHVFDGSFTIYILTLKFGLLYIPWTVCSVGRQSHWCRTTQIKRDMDFKNSAVHQKPVFVWVYISFWKVQPSFHYEQIKNTPVWNSKYYFSVLEIGILYTSQEKFSLQVII